MSAPAPPPPKKKGGAPPAPPAKDADAGGAKEESGPKSFARRDHLREIEIRIQKKWEDAKVYYTQVRAGRVEGGGAVRESERQAWQPACRPSWRVAAVYGLSNVWGAAGLMGLTGAHGGSVG